LNLFGEAYCEVQPVSANREKDLRRFSDFLLTRLPVCSGFIAAGYRRHADKVLGGFFEKR